MEKFNNFLVPILVGCVIGINVSLYSAQKNVEKLQKEVVCQSDSIKQLREEVNNFY
jgi:gas vesicle protein